MFVAGSSYGFIVPVIKSASASGILPFSFLPLQYLIALPICIAVVLIRRIKLCAPKQLASMTLLGIFTGGCSLCYYNAVALLPASAALTLLFQYIWVSVLIECLHRRRFPMRSTVVSIVIVLIGTVFATGLLDGSVGSLDPIGVAFGCGSAVFYALFLYCSGLIATEQPTALRTMMLALGGLLITSIACPSVYVTSLFDASVWPFAIALSILGILLPTSLINYASPKLSTGMVSIMASSELPVGVLAAWAMMGEAPSPFVLFGSMLVLVGIVVKQLPDLARRTR